MFWPPSQYRTISSGAQKVPARRRACSVLGALSVFPSMTGCCGLFADALQAPLVTLVLPALKAKDVAGLACACTAGRKLVAQISIGRWRELAAELLPAQHPALSGLQDCSQVIVPLQCATHRKCLANRSSLQKEGLTRSSSLDSTLKGPHHQQFSERLLTMSGHCFTKELRTLSNSKQAALALAGI